MLTWEKDSREAMRLDNAQPGYPKIEADTLPKYLKLNTERFGSRVFMRKKKLGIWQCYTWRDVYRETRALAMGLIKLGLKRGETVAIAGENEPELFWAEFAAQGVGAKVVFLYPDMTPNEIQYILQQSEPTFFVAEGQEQVDKFLEIKAQVPGVKKVVYWDSRGMWRYDDPVIVTFKAVQEMGRLLEDNQPDLFDNVIREGKGSDIAVLCYTSGTTGLPKGVILTHNYLLDNAFRVFMANDLKPFAQYLSYISPAWGTEQIFLTTGLIRPFTYNFPEKPETILANIRELGAEILAFSPRQWESLCSTVQARMLDAGPLRRFFYNAGLKIGMRIALERTEGVPSSLISHFLYPLAELVVLKPLRDNLGLMKTQYAFNGGAPTSPEVFRLFHAMGIKLRNGYGVTEMGLLTQHTGEVFDPESLGQWLRSHPKFGPPLEWHIDESGGLLVRGGSGFAGYYKNPDATAKSIKGGWYITGDAVKMKENRELIFLDRVSDLKRLSTGQPFPPQFIEIRLRFSPFIKDVMILGDETKAFVGALVNIDGETVGRWAENNGIFYTTFPDLSQKPEVYDLIQKEIERVNQILETQSKVRRFVNLAKEFDPDEAELTRTRKLRRDFLEDRYGKLIQAIYNNKDTFEMEVPVKYRDGRTGFIKTTTRINTILDQKEN